MARTALQLTRALTLAALCSFAAAAASGCQTNCEPYLCTASTTVNYDRAVNTSYRLRVRVGGGELVADCPGSNSRPDGGGIAAVEISCTSLAFTLMAASLDDKPLDVALEFEGQAATGFVRIPIRLKSDAPDSCHPDCKVRVGTLVVPGN